MSHLREKKKICNCTFITRKDCLTIRELVSLHVKTFSKLEIKRQQSTFKHSHKKPIVWNHGPNWPFYAFVLRTKLYQNLFFFTGHQNVNKPKSRAAGTVYGLIFLPFYQIIVSLFSFLCQDANKTRSNCAVIGCNLPKKHKPENLKVSKFGLWWDPFVQSRNCMTLKFTEKLCVMTIKNDKKTEEELTCDFKIGMRNLTNFHSRTQKSKKFDR